MNSRVWNLFNIIRGKEDIKSVLVLGCIIICGIILVFFTFSFEKLEPGRYESGINGTWIRLYEDNTFYVEYRTYSPRGYRYTISYCYHGTYSQKSSTRLEMTFKSSHSLKESTEYWVIDDSNKAIYDKQRDVIFYFFEGNEP